MPNALIFFLVFVALVWGSILLFWRRALATLSREAGMHAKLNARAYAKGTAVCAAAALKDFIQVFSGLSSDVAAVLPWWSWLTMFSQPVLAALLTLIAFFDTSVATAQTRSDK
jgi:hypothetical protein